MCLLRDASSASLETETLLAATFFEDYCIGRAGRL